MVDWRGLDISIEGKPLAVDGLRKRREQLEALVEPHVTSKKTADIITFRGKKKYLSTRGGAAFHAAIALQFLDKLESAWADGDIETAVRMAVGFANASTESRNIELWKSDSVSAMANRMLRKSRCKSSAGKPRKIPDSWIKSMQERIDRGIKPFKAAECEASSLAREGIEVTPHGLYGRWKKTIT